MNTRRRSPIDSDTQQLVEACVQRGVVEITKLDEILARLDLETFDRQLNWVLQATERLPLVHGPDAGVAGGPCPRGLPSGRVSRRYLREVEKYPTMSREDEVASARRMEFARLRAERAESQAPEDSLARQAELLRVRAEFVEHNLHIVVSHAYAYRTYPVPLDDLIQEGNAALMRAVEKFDWRHGVRFRTYVAYWIRQAIERHLATLKGAVRVPHHLQQKYRRLKREGRLPRNADQEPRVEDLAEAFEVERETATHLLEATRPAFSIDQEVSGGGERYRDFLLADWEPEDSDRQDLLHRRLDDLLEELDEREQRVLRLRFGLDRGGEGCTLEQIGHELHLSRERSRQIQQAALSKLRTSPVCARLTEYL